MNIVQNLVFGCVPVPVYELVWELLEMGFDLGSDHDVNKIESHVPEEYKLAYMEGWMS